MMRLDQLMGKKEPWEGQVGRLQHNNWNRVCITSLICQAVF